MKQTVRFLALLMAVIYSTSAFAGIEDQMVVTPDQGVVTSLQHFEITFGDLSVAIDDNAVPTLWKGGGPSYDGTMTLAEDGKTILVDFDVCCTASGQYFLDLPEHSLKINNKWIDPLRLRFIIEGTMEEFYAQITIDPAEGEVESLQSFTISVPEYIGEIEYGSMATLTNTETNETYQAEMFGVQFSVLVYFPEEITEPGNYVLTIPANSILIYTLSEDVHELNFNYTISGAPVVNVGDVNDDGNVSISDVTTLIDYLLSSDPTGVNLAAADVNGDNNVSISDVTALIDMLLNGN